MSDGHPNRRTVLKMGGAALIGGLTGCSGRSSTTNENGTQHTARTTVGRVTNDSTHAQSTPDATEEPPLPNVREEWEFRPYLPTNYLEESWGFAVTCADAIRRDRDGFGPDQTDASLSPLIGKRGWILNDEIDAQLSWEDEMGQRFALETSLSRSEVVSRYEGEYFETSPVDTYSGYTLFTVPNELLTFNIWHAVSEENVLISPTPERSDLEAYIDGLQSTDETGSSVATALNVLDTRYDLLVGIPEAGQTLDDSGIEYQAYCATTSPHMAGEGFKLTTGIVSSTPYEMMRWARKQEPFTSGVLAYNDPTVRTIDNLVLVEEIGTVNDFLF